MTDQNQTLYDYQPPVAQLLTLGEDVARQRDWFDYLSLGLTEADIPELIRMAADQDLWWEDPKSDEVWANLHAWRALGQLRAEAAIELLADLLHKEDDDWVATDLPEVFAMIGPAAIPALDQRLHQDISDDPDKFWGLTHTSSALAKIAEAHPDSRAECAASITSRLQNFAEQDETFNGLLIADLLDLKEVAAAPLMEAAFEADAVDLTVCGDWEDAQIELGLLDKRITPARNYMREAMGLDDFNEIASSLDKLMSDAQQIAQRKAESKRVRQAKTKAKQKRKQAKKQKKKQRKRK